MAPDETTPDAREKELELERRERATKEHDPHERDPSERGGDPLDDDDRKPAPPGPEAQQPRG